MSWKSFACVAALVALAAPAVAAPSIGLVDNMDGTATLQVIADAAGALAAELEVSGSVLTGASIADSVTWDTANPGANTITGTETTGLYDGGTSFFVSYGSDIVPAGTYDLLTLDYSGMGTINASGLVAQLGANTTDLSASVSVGTTGPIYLDGDFDGSFTVGNSDLTLLLNNWNAAVPPVPAGWTGAQPTAPNIGNDELTALLNTWNQSNAPASALAVPEPASAALIALGLAGFVARRK